MILTGIYKIESRLYLERFYIGSSIHMDKRWKEHIKLLLGNKHGNSRLGNHFNKYGLKDLVFSIIEQFDFISKEHLLSREQYYLDALNPWFNIAKVAGSNLGIKKTEEQCRKNGERKRGNDYMKGKHHTQESKDQMSRSRIGQNKVPHSKEHCDNISKACLGRVPWNKGKGGTYPASNKKPILQFDLQGVFIKEWPSTIDAAVFIKLDRSNISKCLRGKQISAGGFLWERKNINIVA